jgi:endonuclease/exonuclease/phosphatase family metal-dependent hydrolase
MRKNITLLLLIALVCLMFCETIHEQNIKIMTFNIRYGTAKDGENSWEHRHSILINCLKKYQPDILGLQEAMDFQVDSIKAAFPKWKSFGVGRYHTVLVPDRPHESMNGESCNIFYDAAKYTLIEQGTFWHSDTPDQPASITWGNTLPRITTWGILEPRQKAKQFLIMNTHFSGEEPYVSNTANLNMLKWREISGSKPTIFMGDYNLAPESDAHELFCGKTGTPDIRGNFVDCWQACGKSEANAGTSNNFTGVKNKTRIDWILATPEFDVNNINVIYYNENGRYPSDHYPVIAELKCDQ